MRIPLATLAATLLMAGTAHAAPISTDYCSSSLRGFGSLAPDNDVKRRWDAFERSGLNIIASSPYQWRRISDQYLRVDWVFYDSAHRSWHYLLSCWRDGYLPTGTYRDDDKP